jgi:hypothetical protein
VALSDAWNAERLAAVISCAAAARGYRHDDPATMPRRHGMRRAHVEGPVINE